MRRGQYQRAQPGTSVAERVRTPPAALIKTGATDVVGAIGALADRDEQDVAAEVVVVPTAETAATAAGYITDFISGLPVRATPEEIEAVQVFSRLLVEDYRYPTTNIQTRPQFRVRRRPSDESKSYPVDIAIFRTPNRLEADLLIVVECKQKTRKKGIDQLKLYMDMSPAEVGAWFNGSAHAYLRKIVHRNGTRTYEELPNIPFWGQRIEDIGRYRRRDLRPPSNLKIVFRDIRNHLAGKAKGYSRDEPLARELIHLLFCKIHDEINTALDDYVSFRAGVGEDAKVTRARVLEIFERGVKQEFDDVFERTDKISLDAASVVYVVGELQNFEITRASRDAVGEAFEMFIGPALRGGEGQFFTPRNVVRMMVEILDPKPGELLIDPACGSGGFLTIALEHVWKRIDAEGQAKGWTEARIDHKKRENATKFFRGIDKDAFLAKVSKAYMAIVGDGRTGVFGGENSLDPPQTWEPMAQAHVHLGSFDVVMTNPPFGSRIPIDDPAVLAQYELGRKWRFDSRSRRWIQTADLHEAQPPQILFIERCLQLLRPGGRMGIVLPEAIFGMPSHAYVVQYLRERAKIRGVISMPEALFKTSGKGGTHTKTVVVFIENRPPTRPYEIFLADAKWCGHDSRGNLTIRRGPNGREQLLDDIPIVAERFRTLMKGIWP